MADYSIKSIRKGFKERGVFYTPKYMAELFKSYIDVPYCEVYDPTCGHGNLLSVFGDEIKKYGQEVDEFSLGEARKELVNFEGRLGDTLTDDRFAGQQFDLIFANPPFSLKYDMGSIGEDDPRFRDLPTLAPSSKADFMFIFHCIHHLKENGQCIILNFPGVCYRRAREEKLRRYLVEQNYLDKVVLYGGKKFEDTSIQTVLFVIRKNRKTTDIEFVSDEHDKSRMVSLEEIRRNNYNLSVNVYIDTSPPKEAVDIEEINRGVDGYDLRKLNAAIGISVLMAYLDHLDPLPKYEGIMALMERWRDKVMEAHEYVMDEDDGDSVMRLIDRFWKGGHANGKGGSNGNA